MSETASDCKASYTVESDSECFWDILENIADNDTEVKEKGDLPNKSSTLNTKRLHKCLECSKVFSSNAHLKEHEVSHSDRQPYRCIVCDKGFKRKNALSKHVRIFHPDGPDTVYCSCGRVYASQELMEKHKECSGSHRLLVCPECGALYKTEASLKSHMILHRDIEGSGSNKSWPFTCQSCGEKFSSQASLNNHIGNFHRTSDFQCQHCDKVCKTKQLLTHHCLRKHKIGNTEFSCPVCNKVFSISKDLRRHLQSHNPQGLHKCSACHAKFKTHSTLQSHMRIHSKGKPYDCVLCLLPFDTIENLKSHIFSQHNIEVDVNEFSQHWNRKCLVCGQIFLRRSGLALHMKSHLESHTTELLFVENSSDDTSVSNDIKNELNKAPHNSVQFTALTESKDEHKTSTEINCSVKVQCRDIKESDKNESEIQARLKSQNTEEEKRMSHYITIMEYLEDDKSMETMCNDAETKTSLMQGNACVTEHVIEPSEENACQETRNDSNVEYKISNMHEIPDIAKVPVSNKEEETKYICGECARVFTDVDDLKNHLQTCYQQDTNDEYVVVFEVDGNP